MMNHCRDFLISEIDDCKNFASIEMKIKMIVSKNSSLMMTREMIILLMINEAILLMIAASLE
jgi:hypothetical protein